MQSLRHVNLMRLLDGVPLHPFLFAAYPVLLLLALNGGEVAPASSLRSLLVALGLAAALLAVFGLVLRDTRKAAVLASLVVVLFFSYGHLYNLMRQQPALGAVSRHRVLVPVEAGLVAATAVALARRRPSAMATRVLNVTALAAVGLTLAQSTWIFAAHNVEPTVPPGRASGLDLAVPEGQPRRDVYYIILDAYTRADVLDEVFHYDNRPFLNALESLGFTVAENSRSNYAVTRLSLPSSLNMDYVDALGPPLVPGARVPDWLDRAARYSRVRSAFEELGYRVVAFESAIGMTDWVDSDLYVSRKPLALSDARAFWRVNPFEVLLAQTSMARLVIDGRIWFNRVFRTDVKAPNEQHREQILFDLDRLGRMGAVPGPKFVFVHIMSPHQPYVFAADGGVVSEQTIFTLDADAEPQGINSPAAYDSQVAYLNTRILEAIRAILANSPTEPIIILQGDHGAQGVSKEDRMKILNAYYLPGDGAKAIYPSISPVNSFRVVFNEYFGGRLPLLDDRSYFSPVGDAFRLARLP